MPHSSTRLSSTGPGIHFLTWLLLLPGLAASAVAQTPAIKARMRQAGATVETYRSTHDAEGNQVRLNAYIFYPEDHQSGQRRAAIVFFFGGGWRSGSPVQFAEHCKHLASRGMVAVAADYRVASRHQSQAKDSVDDAKAAVRWLRVNADQLGIDPNRVAAGGGSAGGHLAACTGIMAGSETKEGRQAGSSRPDAMVLFNPAVALAEVEGRAPLDPERMKTLADRIGIAPVKLSPLHQLDGKAPPTIIFHGTADTTVPYWTVEAFQDAMRKEGNRCELVGYQGAGHGFFNYRNGKNDAYQSTLAAMDDFLVSLGFLDEKTLENPTKGD